MSLNPDLFNNKALILVFVVSVSVLCWSMGSQNVYGLNTGIIVPLYTDPGNDWNTLVKEKTNHPSVPIVAIINPDNGPGTKDTNYVSGVQKLQSSGIKVIGYIYTANVDYKTITHDMDEYKNWYNVNGIFFDQMSYVKGNETFFANLTNYAKTIGLNFTVGNPGIDTLPSYIGTVNNLVTYDNPNLPPVSSFEGWHKNFNKSNFSLISYSVDNLNKTYIKKMTNLVQYMYISNNTEPDQFNTLPGHIDDLIQILDVQKENATYVTVGASSVLGKPLTGLWTVVTFGKNNISGFVPFTFVETPGTSYAVTMPNFQNYTFDHWNDGTKSNSITISPKGNYTLTAYYGAIPVMPINKTISKTTTSTSQIIQKQQVVPHDQRLNYVVAQQQSSVSNTGSISATISYTAGDRAGTYGVSLKIYQDSSQSVYRNIDSISSNPFTIDSLPLGHTYKIQLYANGMGADTEYVRLDQTTQSLAPKNLILHLPSPGGLRPNIFYNDGITPISNAIVNIEDQNNKTWGVDSTDVYGQTMRFWIEPTKVNNDHYTLNVNIGQHMSYSYSPVFLSPGVGREIKIVTPWPPMVSGLVTVKVYDEKSKLLSSINSSFAVDLLDNNGNFISESKINYHGEANFQNLKVGDYVFYLVNPNNGEKWGESKVTIDGTKTIFSMTKEHTPLMVSGNPTGLVAN